MMNSKCHNYETSFLNRDVKYEYKKWISKGNIKYFLTISFSRFASELDSDKNIQFILRFLNKELFGKRYLKKGNCLKGYLARGKKYHTLSHYHILILEDELFTYNDLIDAFVKCCNAADCLDSIDETKKELLIMNRHQPIVNGYPIICDQQIIAIDRNHMHPGYNKKRTVIRNGYSGKMPHCNLVLIDNKKAVSKYLVDHFTECSYTPFGSDLNINTRY